MTSDIKWVNCHDLNKIQLLTRLKLRFSHLLGHTFRLIFKIPSIQYAAAVKTMKHVTVPSTAPYTLKKD